jgi:hypothetical protein
MAEKTSSFINEGDFAKFRNKERKEVTGWAVEGY